MDLTILKSIKLTLEIELSNNLKSTDKLQPVYQNRLSLLIDDLRSLISIIEKPENYIKNKKRCNPDE